MAGKATTFRNDVLQLIFHGVAIADIAENDATSPLTSFWLSMHTAEPTTGQDHNELSYTEYARYEISRASGAGGWTISGNVADNTDDVEFPEMENGAGGTVTHLAIGTSETGSGKLLYVGTIDPNLPVAVGVVPQFDAGDVDVVET